MTTIKPLGEAKDKLSELVQRAASTHERFEITVHGQPKAVLVSADDWESLMETLDVLSDPQTMANLAEAEAAIERGELYTQEQIQAELDERLRRDA